MNAVVTSLLKGSSCSCVPNKRMPVVNSPIDLLDSFFAAWNRHDAEASAAHYDDTAVMEDPLLPAPISGKEAILAYYRHGAATYPDATFRMTRYGTSDDALYVEWDYMVHLGDPKRQVTCPGVSIFRLRDGLIVHDVAYWDPRPLE